MAKLCSVTPKTVQRWIVKRLLRATRNPGMSEYRITRKDYEAFATGASTAVPEEHDIYQETSRALAAALAPKRRR